MPVLLIQDASGESEIRELSKRESISIGRHASNDIRIPDDNVAVLHCRISWNSRGYEVVSGTEAGIEFNGRRLANAVLTLGDCVQIGSISLFYYDHVEQAEAALRGEVVEPGEPPSHEEKRVAWELKQEAQHGPLSATPVRPKGDKRPPSAPIAKQEPEDLSEPSEREKTPLPRLHSSPEKESAEPPAGLFRMAPVRPGQQDVMRSPLITTLGIGTIILVMIALGLWFVIGRDTSQKVYELAVTEMEEKRFTQAITQFEEFLKAYPNHRHASAARQALGLSLVEQPISGAAPAWDRGLKALDEYLAQHRRDKVFSDILPKILELAKRIGRGSAETAGTQKKPELLTISENASRLLQQYDPHDKEAAQEIETAIHQAQTAIRKHETFQKALGQIDDNLKKSTPFAVFETRRKLLLKYPELEGEKELQNRLKLALDAERKLAVRTALDQAAHATELPAAITLPTLNLLRQTRTRADTVPGATNVFTIAQDCCFAADSLTGIVQWRRVIGLDTPFPPQPVSLDVLGLLLFDTRFNELILVRQRDGELIWRQGLSAPAAAAPLVHAGQIFIPTRDGRLCQLDVVTGKLTTQLKFSQPLVTSPVVSANGERLIVAGEQAVLYTLNYRPLECVAVTYTGHPRGSMQSPLLKMGDFLLTAENDLKDSSQLRVWDFSQADQPLSRLAAARIKGQVRDPAVLRGKQLIVPSSPERLSSFTVSDEKGEKALAAAGTYQAERPHGGPIYVTLGPDNELWMTSSTLRRMQIAPDNLLPQKGELGLGISTQPVQVLDQVLYATSRLAWNSATYFMAADRQQMVSQWISVLASRAVIVGTTPANDGSVPLMTDSGDVFTMTAAKLKAGGVDLRPISTLPAPAGLTEPLGCTLLSNGRLAAWCGGPQAKLWLLNSDGAVTRESKLPEPLEDAPILLSGGLLLPLPGKLRLIESSEFKGTIEDLMPAADPQQPARWKGVLPLDEKQAIAVTSRGRVIRAQVRAEPVPHVAEVSSLELKSTVEQPPVLIGNRVYVVTGKQLQCLDVGTLESRGTVALPDVVSQGPWVVKDQLYMVCGRGQLVAIQSEPLAVAWKQQSDGGLAGAPLLRKEQLLFASQTGQVTLRKLMDGSVVREMSAGQPISLGPALVQEQVFVGTLDGSVLLLNPWLEAMP